MRLHRAIAASALLMVVLVSGCGGGGDSGLAPTNSVTIEGRVIDGTTRQGVDGAVVRAGDRWDVTDRDGNYRITGVEPGTQTVTVTPPDGYVLVGDIGEMTLDAGSTELGGIYIVPEFEQPPLPPASDNG